MSFYTLPNPYDPRYDIPNYVMAEPPGRGTFTTKGLRRGTIQSLVPDPLSGDCGCKQKGLAGFWGDVFGAGAAPADQAAAGGGGFPWLPVLLGAGVLFLIMKKKD